MISANSRYVTDIVSRVQGANGNWNLAVYHAQVGTKTLQFTYYSMRQGDTLTRLASVQYADDTLWWVIADANPEVLYWDNLPIGTTIRVPVSGPSIF